MLTYKITFFVKQLNLEVIAMKSYFSLLLVMVIMAIGMPAFAANMAIGMPAFAANNIDVENATPPPVAPFSAADTATAKAAAQQMGELFGLSTPTPAPAATPASTNQPKKSLADVGDKALDMIGNMVGVISQKVEQAAPEVYKIMIRQQLAEAASVVLTWAALFIFALVIQRKLAKNENIPKWDEAHGESETLSWLCGRGTPMFFVALFGIIGAIRIGTAIKMLVNPQYYAIRDLLQMILRNQPPM